MCGIVGYIGKQPVKGILLEGLKRLEYRGYDSAGMAVYADEGFRVIKTTGRVAGLAQLAGRQMVQGSLGISHTRWATHGGVTEANSHPHVSSDRKIALVHNGVIENYADMKRFLKTKGYTFSSETDTEALSNLVAYHYAKEPVTQNGTTPGRFFTAVRKALLHVEGTYGIAVLCSDCANEMVGARKGSPLIVGVGQNEYLLASDVSAIVTHTSNVVYLKDDEVVHMTRDGFQVQTTREDGVEAVIDKVSWKVEDAELGDFPHFMLKEIFDQPESLENAMRGRFSDDNSTSKFGGLNITSHELRQIDRIVFTACGTAWHACLVAEYLIERFARIPVEVEYASEFRYRNAPLDKNTLVFVVSQSGETIDTLGALREAQRKGYRCLAITNVVGSTIARESDGGVYQHAGPEIGVASTKAFTSQILVVSMLALYLGRMRDLSFADGVEFVAALKSAPDHVRKILEHADHIREIAVRYAHHADFLFLGRQSLFPIALEGALKLKEISYIHAEGYPAAEMKHGPIALISEQCPSVFFATGGEILQKVVSNMQEVKARKGKVILVTSEGTNVPEGVADDTIVIPQAHESIMPLLATIPVQLLSYYIAVERGCDVDKPRNLAKSVTVE